jgi:predicted chitinase
MDKPTFYSSLRVSSIFGGRLNQKNVEGMEALLEAGKDLQAHHLANVLAQVCRETGRYMYPIKETVMPSHTNKNPSDEEVIRRLDRAWERGQLKWVTHPYWRSGWFGRGQIQITHERNYRKFGITNPQDALRLPVSARIAVEGMVKGMFTGRKLSDYQFPEALDAPVARNPRRIVNGQDGSDAEVARFHRIFHQALVAAGYDSTGN